MATIKPLLNRKTRLQTDNYKLLELLAQLGESEKAITLLQQQVRPETKAEMAERLTATGTIWESLGKIGKAQKSYKAAILENPYHYAARLKLAEVLQKRGKHKQAKEVLITNKTEL